MKFQLTVDKDGHSYFATLEIKNVTVEDAGKYKVTAKNELGESNATISLNFDSKYNTKISQIYRYPRAQTWMVWFTFVCFCSIVIILIQPIFHDQYINTVQLWRKTLLIEELNCEKLR